MVNRRIAIYVMDIKIFVGYINFVSRDFFYYKIGYLDIYKEIILKKSKTLK